MNNFNQLEIVMRAVGPDFMVLSETRQTEAINDEEIKLEDYDHYYLLSGSSRTGGSYYILESIGR